MSWRQVRSLATSLVVLLLAVVGGASGEELASAPPERPITPEERSHWAYQPLVDPAFPAAVDTDDSAHPVDRFVREMMVAGSVRPLPRAGRATLLRRISFDLTGLPPSAREVERFLADDSPDAYEKLVDRLLAAPAYGERYAQHWLDLARFAETDGFEHDLVRPNAWRYRDWVVDALNHDMPFDAFLSWQLAGDELRPGDPDAAIATGFLLCGPDMPDLNRQDERRHVVLNEMASTVGSVFLGLQFGCAQCHDHKFDPIRQHDFYRLRAFLESAEIFADHAIPTAEEAQARREAEAAAHPDDRQRRERQRELEESGRGRAREKNPDAPASLNAALAELSKAEREEHRAIVAQLKNSPALPRLPMGRVVRAGLPREGHFYIRGDFTQRGPVVEASFPRVLDSVTTRPPSTLSPRAMLAAWLTEREHPLVARVIANRIWQWHFGVGLVPTSSDFGVMGQPPTHPQLLDWLARRMVESGWSMKAMHRLIVTSEAYRAASSPYDPEWTQGERERARGIWAAARAIDPDDRLVWRQRARRLDGEEIRDAMLSVGDRLSSRRGGPGIRPPLSPEITSTLLKDQWVPSGDDEDRRRRSIYLFVRRNLRYPLFDVFDRPDTNASCPQRHRSTTASQSLMMLNSAFSLECAKGLADAAAKKRDTAGQVREIYLRAFARLPTSDEVELATTYLESRAQAERDAAQATALVELCLAVLNTTEFISLD